MNEHECKCERIHFPLEDNIGIEIFNIKNNELAHCPFCDNLAVISSTINDSEIQGLKWRVNCRNTNCSNPSLIVRLYDIPKQAVIAWNEETKQIKKITSLVNKKLK